MAFKGYSNNTLTIKDFFEIEQQNLTYPHKKCDLTPFPPILELYTWYFWILQAKNTSKTIGCRFVPELVIKLRK